MADGAVDGVGGVATIYNYIKIIATSALAARLIPFLVEAEADTGLKQQINAPVDGSAVVPIARAEGFLFSAASLLARCGPDPGNCQPWAVGPASGR